MPTALTSDVDRTAEYLTAAHLASHSIVIHAADGGADRIACAALLPLPVGEQAVDPCPEVEAPPEASGPPPCPFTTPDTPSDLQDIQGFFAETIDDLPAIEPAQCNDLDKTDEGQADEEGDSVYICKQAGWVFDQAKATSNCASFICVDTDCCQPPASASPPRRPPPPPPPSPRERAPPPPSPVLDPPPPPPPPTTSAPATSGSTLQAALCWVTVALSVAHVCV
eukprot:COSAG06_NODE_76_length_25790_cov_35.826749_8_plen_224_part_00